jgi:hypothetical protein
MMWMIVLFVFDMSGDGHFAISKKSFTQIEVCEAAAEMVAEDQKASGALAAWSQCMPIPGTST